MPCLRFQLLALLLVYLLTTARAAKVPLLLHICSAALHADSGKATSSELTWIAPVLMVMYFRQLCTTALTAVSVFGTPMDLWLHDARTGQAHAFFCTGQLDTACATGFPSCTQATA